MIHANPFYVYFKKHYCPDCKTLLKIDYDRKIVNIHTPKAKNYNFAIGVGDSYYKGNVEFRTGFFQCPKCNFKVNFDEMKKIEKSLKNST